MKSHVTHRLSSLSEEIAAARAELRRLRDDLETQRAALDECRLRMLIAETPLAGRDLHAAATGYLRVEREVQRAEQAIATLHADEQRLAERVTQGSIRAGT